jgi:hypothetical protein
MNDEEKKRKDDLERFKIQQEARDKKFKEKFDEMFLPCTQKLCGYKKFRRTAEKCPACRYDRNGIPR